MSLDKCRIPRLGDSSWKIVPMKQRTTMNDPFVERTKEARNEKGKNVSGEMVKTRNQKVSEDKRTTLEVEMHRSPTQDENPARHRTEENRDQIVNE